MKKEKIVFNFNMTEEEKDAIDKKLEDFTEKVIKDMRADSIRLVNNSIIKEYFERNNSIYLFKEKEIIYIIYKYINDEITDKWWYTININNEDEKEKLVSKIKYGIFMSVCKDKKYPRENIKKFFIDNTSQILQNSRVNNYIDIPYIISSFNIAPEIVLTENAPKAIITCFDKEVFTKLSREIILNYILNNKAYASRLFPNIELTEEEIDDVIKNSKMLKAKGYVLGGSQSIKENAINYIFKTQKNFSEKNLETFKETFESTDPEFYKKALEFANRSKKVQSTPELIEAGLYAGINKKFIDTEVLKETSESTQLLYECSD